MSEKAWVLWWRYSDGSASGVGRAYLDEGRACEDFNLIDQGESAKDWSLTEVQLFIKEEKS